MTAIEEKVKRTLRLMNVTAFDEDITDLVNAALLDLGIAGVANTDSADPLIIRAVETYCKLHFGEPEDAERLKAAYDEQKAQLTMATGYTDWGTTA